MEDSKADNVNQQPVDILQTVLEDNLREMASYADALGHSDAEELNQEVEKRPKTAKKGAK